MARYLLFGLSVDSEIELRERLDVATGSPDVVIRWGDIPQPHRKTTQDEEFVRIASLGEFYIRGGQEIVVGRAAEGREEFLRVLLSGRLMAYLLRQRGWFPLHASAVLVGECAVLFLAAVGTGKSTTAAAFHEHGHRVLSDDIAPVRFDGGQWLLQSGTPRLRLCEDAAERFSSLDPDAAIDVDKRNFRVAGDSFPNDIRVARIFLLAKGPVLQVDPVSPLDAIPIIGKECFIRLHRAGNEVVRAHLRDSALIASSIPLRRLTIPRNLSLLDQVVTTVARDLSAG